MIDRCDLCQVTWFDELELSAILKTIPIPASKPLASECRQKIKCPCCKINIETSSYSYDSGIKINKCKSCRGLLLANNQLNEIVYYLRGPNPTDARARFLVRDSSHGWNKVSDCIQSRVFSLSFVVLFLLLLAVSGRELTLINRAALQLLFPLGLIWFAKAFGGLTGFRLGAIQPQVNQTTPPVMVAIAGWILLLTFTFRFWIV